MKTYTITLTDEQDAVLQRIAGERLPQDVIDEQAAYYIKRLLEREAARANVAVAGAETLTDSQKAELTASLLNTKDEYLAAVK